MKSTQNSNKTYKKRNTTSSKGSVKGMGDCSIKITDIVNKINKEIKEEKSISSHNLPKANKNNINCHIKRLNGSGSSHKKGIYLFMWHHIR